MSILLFILILGFLVFVHELGHFLFAKLFGIKVDEFGFGYPPRAKKLFRWKETLVTLNWVPFGGFVKIRGENGPEEGSDERELKKNDEESFHTKPAWKQILVLSGGVIFNILTAWILLSAFFYFLHDWVPISMLPNNGVEAKRLVVNYVHPNSPADEAGIQVFDEIKEYYSGNEHFLPEKYDRGEKKFYDFVRQHSDDEIGIVTYRKGKLRDVHLRTKEIEGKKRIGLSTITEGKMDLNILQALQFGGRETYHMAIRTVKGFWSLITGKESIKALTGPVGIAKETSHAQSLGILALISFIALLSVNLAVINIVPFPALDGGRILFILIEKITRRKIPQNVFLWVNGIGFLLLILLMLFVTYQDILNLVK